MKEQFRDWKFRENIRTSYVDGKGEKNIFEINQENLLKKVIDIVDSYTSQGITLTNRQLYYQLVAKAIIPNADEIYKRICTFITDARYAGLIDWNAIEDRGRTPEKRPEWKNISELIESAINSYRLPRWEDQNYYVEMYCEKQAMESILKPIANKYHIYFGVNKGYSSASTMYELAKRIEYKIRRGKTTWILYMGDHDPSGMDMTRDIVTRIKEFLPEEYSPYFYVRHLALNTNQIEKYNPPPNPAKITDPRAKKYIEEYGNKSWELDALEPKVLMKIAEDGIKELLDEDKYNAWIERENKEKRELIEFGRGLK
jgi:hypothetical protein